MIEIDIPGSKSITQRAIICSCLANGESILTNPLLCEDSIYLIKGLKRLGIKIDCLENRIEINGNGGIFKDNGKAEIFMGNNGTGYRFLLTLSNFYKNQLILTGNEKLQQRPIKPLVDSLLNLRFNIEYLKRKGYPPVKILPTKVNFNKKINVKIDASVSSQFISSLLLSGIFFKKGIEVITEGRVVSTPYIEITLKVMKDFGVDVFTSKNRFTIPEFSTYKCRTYNIEGDFSSASYFMGAAFFLKKEIKLKNLNYETSLQGDKHFIKVLEKMGGKFEILKNEIVVKPAPLHGITIDMNKMPDIVPTLSVVASIAKGNTLIKNIKHLRYKETDRINAICKNLNSIGIIAENGDDYILIKPFIGKERCFNKVIDPEDDHRIAMSFALFKLIGWDVNILNKECVKKSFPDFWKLFETLF